MLILSPVTILVERKKKNRVYVHWKPKWGDGREDMHPGMIAPDQKCSTLSSGWTREVLVRRNTGFWFGASGKVNGMFVGHKHCGSFLVNKQNHCLNEQMLRCYLVLSKRTKYLDVVACGYLLSYCREWLMWENHLIWRVWSQPRQHSKTLYFKKYVEKMLLNLGLHIVSYVHGHGAINTGIFSENHQACSN